MYGILTDDPDLAGTGASTHYIADQVNGERNEPLEGAVNTVACWGDTAAVREHPDRAAVAADGTRATPEAAGQQWGTVCPTDPDYRRRLLDRLERVGAVGDVRLSTPGFPGDAFCHCERCHRHFDESDSDEWHGWRTAVVTDFVAAAADRVAGEVTATLYPDPHPENLRERAGIAPQELDTHVDGFLVPLCDPSYETTYWVESLARGFSGTLEDLDASLTLQLSAGGIDPERLAGLARRLEPHADAIVFGTYGCDPDEIRELFDRLETPAVEAAP